MPQFVRDVEEIRQRAIRKIEEGPVTQAYGVDKDRAITILNEALATEIVCVLRYMHHYFMATGVHAKSVAGEFKEHADAEREHADQIAERISQLGGKPDFNPRSLLERSVSQYIEGESLGDMIREDLIAERIVIDVYAEMIRFFGDKDPTTRVMIEGILKDEEEHASDLADLLYIVDPHTGETEGQDPGTRPLDMQRQDRQPRQERGGNGQRGAQANQGGRASQGEQRMEKGEKSNRGERKAVSNLEATQNLERGELAHEPGTRGRPPRKGADSEIYDEDVKVRAGAEAGRSRAVHVTNPNRKRKKIA